MKHALDPIDRLSEVLFGLIMVLTFTGSLFGVGCAFGRLTGRRPAWVGISMVVLGSVLVGITMALGG